MVVPKWNGGGGGENMLPIIGPIIRGGGVFVFLCGGGVLLFFVFVCVWESFCEADHKLSAGVAGPCWVSARRGQP